MKLHTVNVTAWQPGTMPHIKQVLKGKHPNKIVRVLYKIGCDVTYTVSDLKQTKSI